MRTCCEGCRSEDIAHEKFGEIVHQGPFTTNSGEADPLIGVHGIYWLFAKETYASKHLRRENIEGWRLDVNNDDMIIYVKDELAIAAFRGSTSLNDIKNDVQLSKPNGGCSFEKVGPAIQVINSWLESNSLLLQLTGHSLGGAVARCVGSALQLGVVTFNPAAPPSSPVSIGPNQVHYHIVFDIISAWTPSIRIDKGFRPHSTKYSKYLLYLPLVSVSVLYATIKPLIEAHQIDSFSNQRNGKIINSQEENLLWQNWFNHLPFGFKKAFLFFINTKELPVLP